MIEQILQLLEKLISEFSWRRLFFIIIILMLGLGTSYMFENYSGYFRLSRIEKETNLLEKLANLREKQLIQKEKYLSSIYESIIRDLDGFINKPTHGITVPPRVWQGLAGAAPWLLFFLLFLPRARRGEPGAKSTLFGLIALAFIFGIIGTILPAFQLSWINYIGYPIGHSVIVLFILWLIGTRKKNCIIKRPYIIALPGQQSNVLHFLILPTLMLC